MTQSTRVLHIAQWPRSGVTELIRQLGSSTRTPATEHSVVLLGSQSDFEQYFQSLTPRLQLEWDKRFFKALARLRQHLRKAPPDIIHAHSLTSALLALLCGSRQGILHLHNEYPFLTARHPKAWIKRILIKVAVKFGKFSLVAPSGRISSILAAEKIGPCAVVPNGLPDAGWRGTGPPSFQSRTESLHLISICRLHSQKNLLAAVNAVAVLRSRGIAIDYTIHGDGPEFEKLSQRIEELSVQNSVFLAGYTHDAEVAIAAADGYVSASLFESFGLSILQAMMVGTPVIATRTGDLVRQMTPGIHYVESRGCEPINLADAFEYFYTLLAEERYTLAKNARMYYIEHYTFDKFEGGLSKVYDAIMGQR